MMLMGCRTSSAHHPFVFYREQTPPPEPRDTQEGRKSVAHGDDYTCNNQLPASSFALSLSLFIGKTYKFAFTFVTAISIILIFSNIVLFSL